MSYEIKDLSKKYEVSCNEMGLNENTLKELQSI